MTSFYHQGVCFIPNWGGGHPNINIHSNSSEFCPYSNFIFCCMCQSSTKQTLVRNRLDASGSQWLILRQCKEEKLPCIEHQGHTQMPWPLPTLVLAPGSRSPTNLGAGIWTFKNIPQAASETAVRWSDRLPPLFCLVIAAGLTDRQRKTIDVVFQVLESLSFSPKHQQLLSLSKNLY